jgi:hypothetical protein
MHSKRFALLYRLRDRGLELRIARTEKGTDIARIARTGDGDPGMPVDARQARAVVQAGLVEFVDSSSFGAWDAYRLSDAGWSKSDPERREQKVISACALRFDGYRYIDESRLGMRQELEDGGAVLDLVEETERFFTRPDYTMPAEYLATMLFLIQRKWIREGWLRWDSGLARIARRLFVVTCRYEVPERFRIEDWAATWVRKYARHTTGLVRFVEERDAATVYREEIF